MREKPKRNYTWLRRRTGAFDWAHPKEEQVCYDFILRPDAPKLDRSYVVRADEDPGFNDGDHEALRCAQALEKVYERYIYTASLQHIRDLIKYLEGIQEQDRRDFLAYKLAESEWQVEHWTNEAEHYRTLIVVEVETTA